VKSYFTVRVLQDGKQFGKFETKAKGEETLIEQGWKASQIKRSEEHTSTRRSSDLGISEILLYCTSPARRKAVW